MVPGPGPGLSLMPDADGVVLGEHALTHDHADEQPVTRTQTGLEIPEGVDVVTVEGRDAQNGYGGASARGRGPALATLSAWNGVHPGEGMDEG